MFKPLLAHRRIMTLIFFTLYKHTYLLIYLLVSLVPYTKHARLFTKRRFFYRLVSQCTESRKIPKFVDNLRPIVRPFVAVNLPQSASALSL